MLPYDGVVGKYKSDRIMLNDKSTIESDKKAPDALKNDGGRIAGEKKPATVVSLAIDENDDLGGDPYNHTGSFCVPDFDE